jgi:hypothetical protein
MRNVAGKRQPKPHREVVVSTRGRGRRASRRPLDALIMTVRGRKVVLDADLASAYGVATGRLNEQVKRNLARFPEDFVFRLSAAEKREVIANCDHLGRLRFAKALPWAFTEHGAIMAAMVLHSARAVTMSVFVVRAFVQLRDRIAADSVILRRLADVDRTLLRHDVALRDVYRKLLPLLVPAPDPPRRRIGFHSDDRG